MEDIFKLMDELFNGECNLNIDQYIHPIHGRIVETRFDTFHNVIVYEDGYEERYYIGD